MNKAPRVRRSSALTKHRWPLACQFVWEVYSKPGMGLRRLSAALGMKYFNLNKRASKLVKRCGGLVEVRLKENGRITYHKSVHGLTPNEARAWVKKSKRGEMYE